MTVSAVVFDFDGLVLDTEEPVYLAWKEVWADHGHDLELTEWARCIGTGYADDTFHPVRHLVARCDGRALDEDGLHRLAEERARVLMSDRDALPGVVDWLGEAERAGMGIAIASSSPRWWIDAQLERLGLAGRFPVVACYDDVRVHKPSPAVYVEACSRLDVAPSAALAVEDSANGLAAAKAAGLRCVAVPSAMTAHMDFSAADLVVGSLASIALAEVVERLSGVR